MNKRRNDGSNWDGRSLEGGTRTGWRWIMYAPLLCAGFWLMIVPAHASEQHRSPSDYLPADTLCTAIAEPAIAEPDIAEPDIAEPATVAPAAVAATHADPAPLDRSFRRGHGTRIDCRRRDGQWQAVEQAFQLDDIQLAAHGNGDRTLRAWEDDLANGIVRRRALELPAPTQWRTGSQPDTLSHRLEQRQTNRAACRSTASGHCSTRQTTDTWVQTTSTGVQLVQQRYINGNFAERVSWYLDY